MKRWENYLYQMNIQIMRFLAIAGITISLVLSVWYTLHTYRQGDPQWMYLILTFGIAILLAQTFIKPGKRKD